MRLALFITIWCNSAFPGNMLKLRWGSSYTITTSEYSSPPAVFKSEETTLLFRNFPIFLNFCLLRFWCSDFFFRTTLKFKQTLLWSLKPKFQISDILKIFRIFDQNFLLQIFEKLKKRISKKKIEMFLKTQKLSIFFFKNSKFFKIVKNRFYDPQSPF